MILSQVDSYRIDGGKSFFKFCFRFLWHEKIHFEFLHFQKLHCLIFFFAKIRIDIFGTNELEKEKDAFVWI